MSSVFLSHSSRDNASAGRMQAWLEQQGFEAPFLDFDKDVGIPPGADWEKTLYRKIELSQALLILQSANWSASKWCFAEFTQARALGKPIFQVIETADVDPGPTIAPDLQVLDLRQQREAGLEQLKKQLANIALTAQGGFAWDGSRPPYPGLPAFEEEDAAIYFGRDEEIRHLIERLTARRTLGGARLLVLLGASGSGKSSLLRAGVIPWLQRSGRGWLVVPPFRPQSQPCQELARALALAAGRAADWCELHRTLLEGDRSGTLPAVLAQIAGDLRMAAAANEAQILLSIDQGEELFGALVPEEVQRFFRILTAAMGGDLPFLAVMTLRSEYLGRLQAAEKDGFTTRFEEVSLAPMPLAQIPAIIKGPAKVAGLTVEDAFVQQAAAHAETEDALPLLAFALRRLNERFGGDGHLSLADYQAMGDAQADLSPLENAVRDSADEVLGKQPSKEQKKALRDAFVPAMVRFEQGNYVRRPARWDALPPEALPLLERLVSARLLISRVDKGGHRLLEVAHEALLRKWPLLRRWLDEDREFLIGIQQIEQDMALWQSASPANKQRALLNDLKLEKGQAWLLERGEQISPEVNAFIRTSQRHFHRQRLTWGLVIAAVTTAICVAASQALWQRGKASTAQAFQFAANSRAFINSDPFSSVVYGLAAAEHGEEAMAQHILTTNSNGLTLTVARDDEESRLTNPIYVLGEAIQNNFAITAPIRINGTENSTLKILALKNGGILLGFNSGRLLRWRDELGFEDLVNVSQGGLTSLIQLRNGDIVSGSKNGTLTAWRWRNNQLEVYGEAESSSQLQVTGLIELKNNNLVSSGSDGSVQLWEFQDGHFRRIGKKIDASSNHSPIIGMIYLENEEIATADSTGQEITHWRYKKYGDNFATLERADKRNTIFYFQGMSPNNFVTFGRGSFVYPVSGGTAHIRCEGGGKTLLSDSENYSLTLNYSNIPSFNGILTCMNLAPQLVLVRDGVKIDYHLTKSNSGFPLAVLRLGSSRFMTGDQRGYITQWKGIGAEEKRIASSHSSIRQLIRLGNDEIISLGANDYYSPRYSSYGWGDYLRRWRNPDAQKRVVNTVRTAQDLRSLVAIGCNSIDLNSIAKSDPLSTAAIAAKRACFKLGNVKEKSNRKRAFKR